MKKIGALMFTVVLPLLAQPVFNDADRGVIGVIDTQGKSGIYAYFALEKDESFSPGDEVVWSANSTSGFSSEGIFFGDPSHIIIEHNGVYVANFKVMATADSNYQFGLYLNDELVPGSIYAAPGDTAHQVNGQVIFRVFDSFSELKLVNTGVVHVYLMKGVGYGIDDLFNTNASIFIQRIADLDRGPDVI